MSQYQAQEQHQEQPEGWVYFIGRPNGPIKIGYSVSPEKRLRELQVGSADRLSVMAQVRGTRADEARYHRQFAPYGIGGEWFSRHHELSRLITRLRLDEFVQAAADAPKPELTSRQITRQRQYRRSRASVRA